MEVSGQLHSLYQFDGRLCGAQSWSVFCGAQKNFLSSPEIKPWFPGCLAHTLITIPNDFIFGCQKKSYVLK
jgi:hypothetical protein